MVKEHNMLFSCGCHLLYFLGRLSSVWPLVGTRNTHERQEYWKPFNAFVFTYTGQVWDHLLHKIRCLTNYVTTPVQPEPDEQGFHLGPIKPLTQDFCFCHVHHFWFVHAWSHLELFVVDIHRATFNDTDECIFDSGVIGKKTYFPHVYPSLENDYGLECKTASLNGSEITSQLKKLHLLGCLFNYVLFINLRVPQIN